MGLDPGTNGDISEPSGNQVIYPTERSGHSTPPSPALWTHLLVELCAVVVALLPSTSNRAAHAGRVPGTNAGHLSQPLVGLPRQLLGVPAARDPCSGEELVAERPVWTPSPPGSLLGAAISPGPTFDAPALGDSDNINDLTLTEHAVHRHLLL